MNEYSSFLHNIMDIHDTFSHDVDILIALVHKFPLHFELYLHFLVVMLFVDRILISCLTFLICESAPVGSITPKALTSIHHWFDRCKFISTLFLFRGWLLKTCRLHDLISTISLYPKLLLSCSYFASSIWVKIGLFELLNEGLYLLGIFLNEGLFSFDSGSNG